MFVSESNESLENDEIRPLKQTSLKTGNYFPVCFNSHTRFSLLSEGQVQKERPVLLFNLEPLIENDENNFIT